MSDQNPPTQDGHNEGPGLSREQQSPRDASEQLREAPRGPVNDPSMMDPANQSLAEALRITFRILQFAMVVLIVLYLGSGLQSVQANERGVRLIFGKVSATDLRPGFHWAAPYPFGELIKIDVGNQPLELLRPFWPYVEPGRETAGIEAIRSRAALDPTQDGSVLTGDGAIAHTQWSVRYRRADPRVFVETIFPAHEEGFVRAAVARGAVHAIAEVEIDELLKQSAAEQGSVATRAAAIARTTLSEMGPVGAGIDIDQVSLQQKIPPVFLRDKFDSVLQAESRASTTREAAQQQAATILSETAGGAADLLVSLIDEYERLTDAGDDAQAAATLAKIDRVLDGAPVEIEGEEVRVSLGGQAASTMSRARQYRDIAVDIARSDLTDFQAKLAVYKSNPSVMVATNWMGALSSFFSDPSLEVFFQPTGTDLYELVINADPEIRARMERERRQRLNEQVQQQRLEDIQRRRTETTEGLQSRG